MPKLLCDVLKISGGGKCPPPGCAPGTRVLDFGTKTFLLLRPRVLRDSFQSWLGRQCRLQVFFLKRMDYQAEQMLYIAKAVFSKYFLTSLLVSSIT